MNDEMSRVLMCIAALNLTKEGLAQVLNELQSISLEEFGYRVADLRKFSQQFVVREERFEPSRRVQKRVSSVGDRVERLLKVEAKLSTQQAVAILTGRLVLDGMLRRHNVPALSRKSFREWIQRLVKIVPEKNILRCATIIRNERVHGPTRDWTLTQMDK